MAARLTSLAAVIAPDSRLLVLGSMPGAASLAAQQYYAHPRNAFWPIMGQLFGFAADLPYAERLMQLRARGIGLWDVLQSCERQGSLDSAIRAEQPNDFASLLQQQPGIRVLAFNGAKAAQSFRKLVLPSLQTQQPLPILLNLPSTSPAHASVSRTEKLAAWAEVLTHLD
ncbi:MAG: DNA-deoxyinosine glycosylase [Alishewanella aestuarii]